MRPPGSCSYPDSDAGRTFNIYVAQEPAGLDSQLVTYPLGEQITSGVQSRLFRYKTGVRGGPNPNLVDDIESEPDLALSAESPDAITWAKLWLNG
jgi:hypothetical protein